MTRRKLMAAADSKPVSEAAPELVKLSGEYDSKTFSSVQELEDTVLSLTPDQRGLLAAEVGGEIKLIFPRELQQAVANADVMSARRDRLVAHAAATRWRHASAGVTVDGVQYATTDFDQAKIAHIKQAFDAGVISGQIAFKAVSGFVMLDAAGFNAVYEAMVARVQACFAAEHAAVAAIAADEAQSAAQVEQFFAYIQ
jgi:Domain of unknown function (DUF4376)